MKKYENQISWRQPQIYMKLILKSINATNNRPYLTSTDMLIPIVIRAKNITNSNGFRTGVLNRTIDNAPIIPRDKAIFPEITLVIINVITGNKL